MWSVPLCSFCTSHMKQKKTAVLTQPSCKATQDWHNTTLWSNYPHAWCAQWNFRFMICSD
ncbi:hypothetical protein PHET_00409 [Paragonimus heterotremus]|uniref:Uncharacterized protein n=1 Tax=Paragonimus heterotremus TaxID=100268 RepID=A0A8J4SUR1_9TREM|nr:hypothetical protein PHET_00409 [Paragonimus heterotremus]